VQKSNNRGQNPPYQTSLPLGLRNVDLLIAVCR